MIKLNHIYNENNCDTMSRMEDESIDLTVTSPPYDKLRDYDGYEWNFELVAKELYRVTKIGGVVVWVVNDSTINGSETLTSFKQAIFFRENCGFNLHDTMFYRRQPRFPDDKRYQNAIEYMFVLSKGEPKVINLIADKMNLTRGTKRIGASERNIDGSMRESWLSKTGGEIKDFGIRDNIWEIQTGYNQSSKDIIAFDHPAIFPEQLAKDHILSWSNERELVYDPFMGSGTVAKMCILTNRNYVGSEISQKYCELAEKRIMPYKQQLDVFYNAS